MQTEAETDADGRFTLAGLGRDRIASLKIAAPNVVDTRISVMTRGGPDFHPINPKQPGAFTPLIHAADFTRKLERGRTVKGLVRDRDSHQPIAGMWVGPPRNVPWTALDAGTFRWVTDQQGRFTITGMYPHDDTVTAISPPGMTYEAVAVQVPDDFAPKS